MRNRLLVWILAAGMFLIGIDLYIVSPVLLPIATDLHVSMAAAGLLVTAFALPYGLLALVFGPISDRVGRRRMLLTALPIFVLASAATALAPDFTTLMIARAVAGAAGAAFTPSLYAAVGDLVDPGDRPKAMGIILSGATLGMILGVPVGAWLAELTSWRGSFWFVTAIALVALAFLAARLPHTQPAQGAGRGYWAAYRKALSAPGALPALAASFLFFGTGNAVYTYVGGILAQRYQASVGMGGLLLATFALCNFLGNLATPVVVRWLGTPRRAFLVGVGGAALAVAGVFLAPAAPLWVFLLCLALWGSACGFALPAQQALLAGLGGSARGTLLSLGSAAMYLGIMALSAVVSRTLAWGGLTAVGWLGLIGLAGALVAAGRVPQPQAATAAPAA